MVLGCADNPKPDIPGRRTLPPTATCKSTDPAPTAANAQPTATAATTVPSPGFGAPSAGVGSCRQRRQVSALPWRPRPASPGTFMASPARRRCVPRSSSRSRTRQRRQVSALPRRPRPASPGTFMASPAKRRCVPCSVALAHAHPRRAHDPTPLRATRSTRSVASTARAPAKPQKQRPSLRLHPPKSHALPQKRCLLLWQALLQHWPDTLQPRPRAFSVLTRLHLRRPG